MRQFCTLFGFLYILFFSACQKHYVNVTKIALDKTSLASRFAKTLDPRQNHPPQGQQLLIEWSLASIWEEKPLFLDLSIIYKDYSEEMLRYEVMGSRGMISYFLLGEKYIKRQGLMTYQVELKTPSGDLLKQWKHKLWFVPIKEEASF